MEGTPAWRGKYIEVHDDDGWEYVTRTRGVTAAVILALTDAGEVVLVEQLRRPLKRRCVELPAGLVGDELEGEEVAASAARELEEETGFHAEHWEEIGEFASSPGMAAETFHLFRATGLRRVGNGGGVAGEELTVHIVPIAEVPAWLASKRSEGCAVDVKLLTLFDLIGRGLPERVA